MRRSAAVSMVVHASLVKRTVSVAVVVGVFCGAAQAWGSEQAARANALFKEAKQSLEGGDAERALTLVKRASSLFQHPAIALLEVRCLRTLGRLAAAQKLLLSQDLRKLPRPLRAAYQSEKKEVANAQSKAGQLTVKVRPAHARVVVGSLRSDGTFRRWVPAGRYRVRLSAPGYVERDEPVQVSVGEHEVLEVELRKAVGQLTVDVAGGLKGVSIELDGSPMRVLAGEQAGDRTSKEIRSGQHKLTCRRGKLSEEHSFELGVGKSITVRCHKLAPSSVVSLKTAGWGGVVVGAALLGYGSWGLQSYFADLERAEREGLLVDSNKHYGGAAYIASGLAVGIASYLFLVREPSKAPARDALWATPTGEESYSAAVR